MHIFYHRSSPLASGSLTLDEDTSRHAVQVLRLTEGHNFQLTDGTGKLADARMSIADKKRAAVVIDSIRESPPPAQKTILGISMLKNTTRLEWLFEKATEIGVTEIVPLICDRTEKEKFRKDRLEGILISAMIQSQQTWLPILREPVSSTKFFQDEHWRSIKGRYIAHCMDGEKVALQHAIKAGSDNILLIGPEGDFTPRELELAIAADYVPVSLGSNRLRTETAGMVGVTLMRANITTP